MHSLALLYCELIAARFSGYSPGPHLRVVFLFGSGSSERGNGRLGETSETDDFEVAGRSVSIAGVDARSESASRRETIGIRSSVIDFLDRMGGEGLMLLDTSLFPGNLEEQVWISL